jgi:Sec1 family
MLLAPFLLPLGPVPLARVMDQEAVALAGAARSLFTAALSTLPPLPKRLYVDDELFCRATSSSPLLALFASPEALRKTYAVTAVLPLSTAASDQALATLASPPAAPSSLPPFCPVFLLRPTALAARHVATALQVAPRVSARALVLVTPRRSGVVERILRTSIASGFVRVAALPLGFLPYDDSLISLCWPRAFSQVVLEGNNAAILAASAALRSLAETLDIEYTTIRSAGAAGAATVEELLHAAGRTSVSLSLDRTVPTLSVPPHDTHTALSSSDPWFVGDVSVTNVLQASHRSADSEDGAQVPRLQRKRHPVTLVVLDRNVDVVTPLLTQWTYEGLLDEAVGLLRGNVMDVGVDEFVSEDAADMLGAESPDDGSFGGRVEKKTSGAGYSRRVQKRLRREGDPIFGQLRDLNYWAAARLLGSVASSVQAYYDARPGRDTAEIGQVKDYVRGLREVKSEHRSAAVHTAIAAEVSARTFEQAAFKRRFELEREMLEGNSASGRRVLVHDAISRNEPLADVLRLFCLWSLTSGGVDAEAFDFLRREIVGTYSLSVLPLLGNLERAGLATRSARIGNSGGMPWNPFKFGGGGDDGSSSPSSEKDIRSGPVAGSPAQPSSVVGYSWQFVRAAMHLMTNFDPETFDSGGISGPYSGYVPLTVRLTEAGVSSAGWSKLPRIATHTLLLPPGHTTAEHVKPASDISGLPIHPGPPSSGLLSEIDAVVLFVGGIARAEASAIRAAAAKMGKKILIATTDVFGSTQFVKLE